MSPMLVIRTIAMARLIVRMVSCLSCADSWAKSWSRVPFALANHLKPLLELVRRVGCVRAGTATD